MKPWQGVQKRPRKAASARYVWVRRLGIALLAVAIASALAALALNRPVVQHEDRREGDLVVVEVIYGMDSKYGGGFFGYVLRDAAGQEVHARFGRLLAKGEHIYAAHARVRGTNQRDVLSYVRCGSMPCEPKPRL